MNREAAILDRWLELALVHHPAESAQFIAAVTDRFRNPVGSTLRENLAILLRELAGGMDRAALRRAMGDLMRLRALQEDGPAGAVEFVCQVRPLLQDSVPGLESTELDDRVAQLALLAAEEHGRCRAHLAELRMNEGRRAMAVPLALARARG